MSEPAGERAVSRRRRFRAVARWLLPVLIVVASEVLFPELAFARGGGGGHSGGSVGHSGGGSSG
ncbi:MAG: hypothetical protein M3Y62_03020, partial [Candidatus Dormibacteraeota bacterium]|nr:hypothetical protein [Candidatus Dormibacteraeota bacterium]